MKKIIVVISFLIIIFPAVSKNIVVVGAGLSGLTAAYDLQKKIHEDKELSKANISMDIYEAKDRPGGRIFTVLVNGRPAEMGGQNIKDGGDAPTFHRLLKEFGLSTIGHGNLSLQRYFYDSVTNMQYDENDLVTFFPQISAQEITQTLSEGEKSAKNLKDVSDYFFKKYKSSDLEIEKKREVIKRIIASAEKGYEGGDLENLSPRYAHGSLIWMFTRFLNDPREKKQRSPHSHLSVEGGNSKLILALEEKLKGHIHYNFPLTRVLSSKNSQESKKNSGFDLFFSKRNSGKPVHADILILAIPASVFKNIDFDPTVLSGDRLEKIKSIAYATHAKIQLPDIPKNKISAGYSTKGLYIWRDSADSWSTAYFSGDAGIIKNKIDFSDRVHLVETAMGLKKGTLQEVVAIPEKIFSNHNSTVSVSWAMDPFIQGSYSYFTPALKNFLEKIITVEGEPLLPLFEPIAEKIYFAGEHTTVDQEIRGTMEAAAESGAKAARMIANELRKHP